jgi:hypothetical protein
LRPISATIWVCSAAEWLRRKETIRFSRKDALLRQFG